VKQKFLDFTGRQWGATERFKQETQFGNPEDGFKDDKAS
jgi:hypothetical protein